MSQYNIPLLNIFLIQSKEKEKENTKGLLQLWQWVGELGPRFSKVIYMIHHLIHVEHKTQRGLFRPVHSPTICCPLPGDVGAGKAGIGA